MALSPNWIQTNKSGKEIKAHGTVSFPCAAYERILTDKPGDEVSWHWHEEFELIYVVDNEIDLQVPSHRIHLERGDLALINSNFLHFAKSNSTSRHQAFVFSPRLITGSDNSVFAQNYVTPLCSCGQFSCFVFDAEDQLSKYFPIVFEKMKNDLPGYEFMVREYLSRVILSVFNHFKNDMQKTVSDPDNIRMTRMLDYMHHHFAETIHLSDLGKVTHLSEREVLRCFHRSIGESPLQYLIRYRLMRSAEFLKNEQDKSISEISGLCGFSSPAYYTKKFHSFYHCTPRQYRENI